MSLVTSYLGMILKNPIVASSSPLSHTVDSIRRLEDAGAAAVVMYSLFEEQITCDSFYIDYYLTSGTNSYAESLSYFPEMQGYNVWPDEYMNLIRRAKEAVDIPIIGSLNGVSAGGWTDYATLMEEAGADGIELNVYYIPTNGDLNSHAELVGLDPSFQAHWFQWASYQHRARRLSQYSIDIRSKQRPHPKAGPMSADADQINGIPFGVIEDLSIWLPLSDHVFDLAP